MARQTLAQQKQTSDARIKRLAQKAIVEHAPDESTPAAPTTTDEQLLPAETPPIHELRGTAASLQNVINNQETEIKKLNSLLGETSANLQNANETIADVRRQLKRMKHRKELAERKLRDIPSLTDRTSSKGGSVASSITKGVQSFKSKLGRFAADTSVGFSSYTVRLWMGKLKTTITGLFHTKKARNVAMVSLLTTNEYREVLEEATSRSGLATVL
mmetsp:Transcript_19152/g.32192  ORF Transcript_19152/g.32192 Transcript_19152/m.32192 type:complete len:216 (-) Transcript_19152:1048-1695(-)